MESYYSSKLAWSLVLACAMAAATITSPCAAQNTAADFVSLHNTSRALVGVVSVTWDTTVAAYAQNYANARRADCSLVHSINSPYGENLYWSSASTWTASSAVTAWTNEKQWYNYAANTCASGKVCGHYTQVVWSSSTSIGCAGVVCDGNRGVFVICSYNPPGNIDGQKPY